MNQDLRSVITLFEKSNELIHVKEELDPRYEVTAALTLKPKGPALFFDRVKGYSVPIVGNVLNTRKKYGLALGVPESDTFGHTVRAFTRLVRPVLVDDGVCQEMTVTKEINLMKLLPIPDLCEKDRNPYISAGMLVAKDPETGARNLSMNRLQVMSPDDLMVGMAPSHHLFQLLKKAEARRQKLPVAVSVGNHPAVLVAANMYVELGFDEFEIAGGLLGFPLSIVRGKTVDVEAPAFAEIVIEGEIDPARWEEEGPFGEFSGLYESYGKSPMMKVTAITHRRNPIFQMIVPSKYPEHCLTGGIAIEATVYQSVKRAIPGLKEVVITDGGCGRLHIVLSIAGAKPGEAKKAIFAAFANLNLAKLCIVVDDDIDPRDPAQVEWAMATRLRADRDVVIVPGVKTDRAEPMEQMMTVANMGIDATKPFDMPPETVDQADVPKSVKRMVAQRLESIFPKQ